MYPIHLLTRHLPLCERIAAAQRDIALGRMDLASVEDFLGEILGAVQELAVKVEILEEDMGNEKEKWGKLKKRPKLWAAIMKVLNDRTA